MKTLYYKSITDIPTIFWDDLGCNNNLYYGPEFLKSFEDANETIVFTYILIIKKNKAVAFANTQIINIPLKTITKNVKISDSIKPYADSFLKNSFYKVLFVGNIFLSGEYGTYIKDGENRILLFKELSKGIKKIAKETNKLKYRNRMEKKY